MEFPVLVEQRLGRVVILYVLHLVTEIEEPLLVFFGNSYRARRAATPERAARM